MIAPRHRSRRVYAINRFAHKTGVLYNRIAPSPIGARYGGSRLRASRYKTAVLCNRRASNIVRRWLGVCIPPPASGLCPPGGSARVPSAQNIALAYGGRKSKVLCQRQEKSFPHTFQHPPAPQSLRGAVDPCKQKRTPIALIGVLEIQLPILSPTNTTLGIMWVALE